MTSATCGLNGWLSSESAALQQSLESRLRRQLDGAGSTLFSLTWKAKATPAGRPYCQLVASALRTSGSGYGSWPTPTAQGTGSQPETASRRKASCQRRKGRITRRPALPTGIRGAQLAAWSTPRANKWGFPDAHGSQEAPLASWRSPNTVDSEERASCGIRQHVRFEPSLSNGDNSRGALEWLPCRDGKLRPTQPGLQPLAHGVPARVGKLRAAGNAIVPQVAAEFIRACEE
jgi:hypothetical protein